MKTFAVSVKKLSNTLGYFLIFWVEIGFFLSRKSDVEMALWKRNIEPYIYQQKDDLKAFLIWLPYFL